jgi:RNA polymerase sporulation-specific sigma factor
VKVSRGIKERAATIKMARSQLLQKLGREPNLSELAELTGFSPEDIAVAETATVSVESIHQEAGEDGFTLENVLTDTESEDKMVERISLRQAIEKLPEQEKMVVQLRYFHGLTQERVAKVLSVSQVQVSRIEKRALGNLKKLLL